MAIEVLLAQVLVLGFTAALWWIARRDLAARAAPSVPPSIVPTADTPTADTAELEQLCATLETLVTSLARRLDAVERAAEYPRAEHFALPLSGAGGRSEGAPAAPVLTPAAPVLTPAADPLPDPRYEPVYALLSSGITDPVEIARRTGLGRGEVDLLLSLRDRRAL